jgi:hypothetical protein
MKKLIVLFFFVIGILSGSAVRAQVTLGGLLDLEVRRAGSDSSPEINQTPKSYWSLYTPNVRLFIQGDISDQWFVSAALHADHYYGRTLSEPFFSVINLNWICPWLWPAMYPSINTEAFLPVLLRITVPMGWPFYTSECTPRD